MYMYLHMYTHFFVDVNTTDLLHFNSAHLRRVRLPPMGSACEQRRRYDPGGEAEDHMSWSTTACLGKLR